MSVVADARHLLCACALAALGLLGAREAALAAPAAMLGDAVACGAASHTVQRDAKLPPRLLDAIGIVETGRVDPIRRVVAPWPWSINANGEGHFYDSKTEAVAAARAFLAAGTDSIDVGCMQINLRDHPDAFVSLDQAFDPLSNTAYAGRFLWQLFARTGAWPKAAAAYHSQTPGIGEPYGARVMALWPDAGRYGGAALPAIDPDDVMTPAFRSRLLADAAFRAARDAAMRGRPKLSVKIGALPEPRFKRPPLQEARAAGRALQD
jgi:hypothetical protein